MEQNSPLYTLFIQLRRRRFLVGVEDYFALKQSLKVGFGWQSREALRSLCCSLWAKSEIEQQLLITLFDQLELPDWDLTAGPASTATDSENSEVDKSLGKAEDSRIASEEYVSKVDEQIPATQPQRGLPPIDLAEVKAPLKPFVFVPHFPLGPREVMQQWRDLRDAERSGPLEELDIDATIALRSRQGITGPVVLRARRQRTSRLLVLVDQLGSMAPFHSFVKIVWETIKNAARLGDVAVYYFHDSPVEGADEVVLESLTDRPFPVLDYVFGEISALDTGYVYEDEELLSPVFLPRVLQSLARGGKVVLLSDAGAARGHYDLQRLLDTVSFIKALKKNRQRYVWLNPLPISSWKGTTAEQIARHVSMFPLDKRGLQKAASVLRGEQCVLKSTL